MWRTGQIQRPPADLLPERAGALGDLNNDGQTDIVVADTDSVRVLLNNGRGTFASPARFRGGISPMSVAIGDLNGDGKPDVAVANVNGDNVSVLLNTTN